MDSKPTMDARKWTAVGMLAIAGFAIAGTSCVGSKAPVQSVQTREARVLFDSTNKALNMLAFLESKGAKPTLQEIEAHGFGDDQKLTSTNDEEYGPMAEIYPIPDLSKLTVAAYQVTTPIPVAVVIVNGSTAPDPNPMQLQPGTNCLYLRHSTSGPDRWIGYVNGASPSIPEGPVNCDPNAAGHELQVASHQMNGQSANAYAAVARFSGDPHDNTVAGLRCADAWCEFGTNVVVPSQTAGGEPGATIKGWHDEQRLAVYDAQQQKLKRSHILATIYPDKNYDPKAATDQQWHVVAHIEVKDPKGELATSKYGAKWGLLPGTNDLKLKYTTSTKTWDGLIIDKKGNSHPIVVTYGMSQGDYPGVARWRWTDNDESGWIGCFEGCCLVDDSRIIMKTTTVAAASTTKRN